MPDYVPVWCIARSSLTLRHSSSYIINLQFNSLVNMATQAVANVDYIVDHSLGSLQTSKDNLIQHNSQHNSQLNNQPAPDALLFILPLLIVLSTFLFILLIFLVCVIFVRRRRGIVLRDSDGPTDMSREELIDGEGGLEGVESRWLESVSENVRRSYLRAKGRFRFSSFLIPYSCDLPWLRVPIAICPKFGAYRYHIISIPLYPGERCFSMVLRTRLRNY
jgi:hypothetical protein